MIVDISNYTIEITANNIHVTDSYLVKKKSEMTEIIEQIKKKYIEHTNVFNLRSVKNLVKEWRAHNLLYKLHIYRSHTKDVDLDIPQSMKYKIAYGILSFLYF